MFFNISTKEKKTKTKLILANITTVSGQIYLLTKIHDVGWQEHVTAVRYIMHNEINPRKYYHSFRANVPFARDT
jgi:hypothetical protein